MMQKNEDNLDIEKYVDAVGGYTRLCLQNVLFFLKIRKAKPVKQHYIIGPKKSEDYFAYTNYKFRNLITTIIIGFVVFVIIAKAIRTMLSLNG